MQCSFFLSEGTIASLTNGICFIVLACYDFEKKIDMSKNLQYVGTK